MIKNNEIASKKDPRRVLPSLHTMQEFYIRNEPFFDAFGSDEGFDCCGYWQKGEPRPSNYESKLNLYRQISSRLNVKSGDLVLDAGCGMGEPARMVSQETGAKVIGLDIQARRLKRFADKGRFPNSQTHYLQADSVNLPFPAETFNAVYSNECIIHFKSRKQYFQEALRVLKPGGRLVITDYILGKYGAPEWMEEIIRYHFYTPELFSFPKYHKLSRECGLEPISANDFTTPVYRAHRIAALNMLKGFKRIEQFLAGPRIYIEGTLFLLLAPRIASRSPVRFAICVFEKP